VDRAPLASNVSVFNERKAYVSKTVNEINSLFVDQKTNKARYSHFVIAGPGVLKSEAASHTSLLPLVKEKLLKVVDTSYPFAKGLAEAINKSSSAIGEAQVNRESELLQKLMDRIAKDKCTYAIGAEDTFEAMESGCAKTILICERACKAQTIVCQVLQEQNSKEGDPKDLVSGKTHYYHVLSKKLDAKIKQLEAESKVCIKEIVPFVDWCLEYAHLEHSIDVELITSKTEISLQFEKGFGGLAALTRYEFHPTSEYERQGLLEEGDEDHTSSSSEDDDFYGVTEDIFG